MGPSTPCPIFLAEQFSKISFFRAQSLSPLLLAAWRAYFCTKAHLNFLPFLRTSRSFRPAKRPSSIHLPAKGQEQSQSPFPRTGNPQKSCKQTKNIPLQIRRGMFFICNLEKNLCACPPSYRRFLVPTPSFFMA